MNKTKEDKVIEEFMKNKEKMERFIKEELESRKSALKEKLKKQELYA